MAYIDELTAISPEANDRHPGDLDHEECEYGEHERDVKIGVHTAKQWRELGTVEKADRTDARCEFEKIRRKYEEEHRRKIREERACELAALERLSDVVVYESEEPFEQCLESARDELRLAANHDRDHRQYQNHRPARNKSVGDRYAEDGGDHFGRQYDMNSFVHSRYFSTRLIDLQGTVKPLRDEARRCGLRDVQRAR